MKIVVISDNHGNLPEVPECDLLLLCGDLCPANDHNVLFQAEWLDTNFRDWLESVPATNIVGIAGNHDFVFERAADLVPQDLPWTYLQDSACEIDGIKIWGSPWQPQFCRWAFNLEDRQLEEQWKLIPEDTEVLLTHGPPYNILDKVYLGAHVGCKYLAARIKQLPKLRLHCFGHIHGNYGAKHFANVQYINAALLNDNYRMVHQPLEIEYGKEAIRILKVQKSLR